MRRLIALPALIAVALALASGCGDQQAAPASHAAQPASSAPTSTTPDPSQVDPSFDMGQDVFITADGFRPAWLVSILGKAVTWHNLLHQPVTIVFDHQPVRSKAIPPGGTFSYTPPTPVSMPYHSQAPALHGALQVTPPASP